MVAEALYQTRLFCLDRDGTLKLQRVELLVNGTPVRTWGARKNKKYCTLTTTYEGLGSANVVAGYMAERSGLTEVDIERKRNPFRWK